MMKNTLINQKIIMKKKVKKRQTITKRVNPILHHLTRRKERNQGLGRTLETMKNLERKAMTKTVTKRLNLALHHLTKRKERNQGLERILETMKNLERKAMTKTVTKRVNLALHHPRRSEERIQNLGMTLEMMKKLVLMKKENTKKNRKMRTKKTNQKHKVIILLRRAKTINLWHPIQRITKTSLLQEKREEAPRVAQKEKLKVIIKVL